MAVKLRKWYFVKHLFLQKKLICLGIQSQSYTLILFTWNILYSPLMLSKYFDKDFLLGTSLITICFQKICFTLFLIYFKYILWTIYRPMTEGLLDQKIRDSIFFKTSTLDVNYDCCHQKRVSSPNPKIFQQESTLWDKDFKREWSEMMKAPTTFWPLGIIGNARLISLSCPYLTITKCA
jgi:hypothetical protein